MPSVADPRYRPLPRAKEQRFDVGKRIWPRLVVFLLGWKALQEISSEQVKSQSLFFARVEALCVQRTHKSP